MAPINDHEEWRAEEQAEFAALPRAQSPPPALQEKIIHALKAKGLMHMTTPSQIWTLPRAAAAAAVAALFLILGFGLAKWQSRTPEAASDQALFVLFLYDGEASPAHAAAQVEEYRQWAMQLHKAGKMITGEKLKFHGRVLRLAGDRLEESALEVEPRNAGLGGYFLIAAANMDEAARLAATCPHLKFGGTNALREIDPT